jgi:hypothetical protein
LTSSHKANITSYINCDHAWKPQDPVNIAPYKNFVTKAIHELSSEVSKVGSNDAGNMEWSFGLLNESSQYYVEMKLRHNIHDLVD